VTEDEYKLLRFLA